MKNIILLVWGFKIMFKKLKWASVIFGVSYSLACLSIFSLQKRFIYAPVPAHPKNKRVKKIYNNKGQLLALDFDREYSEHTIILFHGRDRNAGFRGHYSKILGRKTRLLVIEYPGFGENHKEKLSKAIILKHCHEAMMHILSTIEGPFTVVGESLGSGIASEIANFYKLPKLILITPYSTMADLAQNRFWYFPTRFLLQHNYDSINNLKAYEGEVLFVISENDILIPTKFGKKLLNSFYGNKKEIFVN